MSQDKVNKIVFCSLDEYKTLNKEENTGYIIDAKDVSEAITNSDAIESGGHSSEGHSVDLNQEPDFIWLPHLYKKFDLQNVKEPASLEYETNNPSKLGYAKPVIFQGTLKNKQVQLLDNVINYDALTEVNIGNVSIDKFNNLSLLRIPLNKEKLPFFFRGDTQEKVFPVLSTLSESTSSSEFPTPFVYYSVGESYSSLFSINIQDYYSGNPIYNFTDKTSEWSFYLDEERNYYIQSSFIETKEIKEMQDGPEKEAAKKERKTQLIEKLKNQNNLFYFCGVDYFQFSNIQEPPYENTFNWFNIGDLKIRFKKLHRS